MATVADIEEVLASEPAMKASQIAKRLEVDRREVSRMLHGDPERFIQNNDSAWSLKPEEKPNEVVRRPGPFGPAKDLLPQGQRIEIMSADTPCHVALEQMISNDYSVVPVRDAAGHIIGVFSVSAFAERVNGVFNSDVSVKSICEQSIEDCMTPPQFLDPDLYIDTTVDWSTVEYVIVGSREEPEGILTVADVWAKLNDFAEAYVLLNEIETDLRTLIAHVAEERLSEWIDKIWSPHNTKKPQSLEEFTFNQYKGLICEKKVRWPCFERVLDQPRDLFMAEFERVNELRNDVMHFREQVSVARCNQLRTYRDRTRAAIARAQRKETEE